MVADKGVSGIGVPLQERPEGRRLFDLLRSGDTLVVRWVGRLARGFADVTETIREFMRRGVIVRTVVKKVTLVSGVERQELYRFLDAGSDETVRTLSEPASKKRRGTKSRGVWGRVGSRAMGI